MLPTDPKTPGIYHLCAFDANGDILPPTLVVVGSSGANVTFPELSDGLIRDARIPAITCGPHGLDDGMWARMAGSPQSARVIADRIKNNNQIYFIVMATGLVQGVFGSSLKAQAIECAKRIPFGGCVFLASLNGRPVVGKSCTPQTDWEEIPVI